MAAGVHAIVDACDHGVVAAYDWVLDPRGRYAVTYPDPHDATRRIRMHRLLMQPRSDQVVDHIDGDGLNNRRSNLRCCTQAQNCRNISKGVGGTSRFKGVSRGKGRRKFRAQIRDAGTVLCLGYFESEEDAARAYDDAAFKLSGGYAKLNFPRDSDVAAGLTSESGDNRQRS